MRSKYCTAIVSFASSHLLNLRIKKYKNNKDTQTQKYCIAIVSLLHLLILGAKNTQKRKKIHKYKKNSVCFISYKNPQSARRQKYSAFTSLTKDPTKYDPKTL